MLGRLPHVPRPALFLLLGLALAAVPAFAQPYLVGSPTLTDLWVDPVAGDDARSGATRAEALRTVTAAWDRVPAGSTLTGTGWRIRLLPGTYPESSLPGYLESRYGTWQFPVVFESVDGPGSVTFGGDLNVYDCRFFYLVGFSIVPDPPGDVIHFEKVDHALVRKMHLDGGGAAHETLKANQTQYLYVEESDLSGTYENALDCVACQHGWIWRSKFHDAGDWCLYLKGGSSDFRVEGNELYRCGTGGFTAGQGTGFEYMVSPWLHYEAEETKFVNNVVHDTEGACFGANGAYNTLFAHNTCYRTGSRSHAVEVVFGARSCDGDFVRCAANQALGGWGPSGGSSEPIPDRHVWIFDNIVYNPAPFRSAWQQLAVYGPQTPTPGTNVPSPAECDVDLRIRGNIFWNGAPDLPLGVGGEDSGCRDANPTCNPAQLLAENTFNTLEPQLVDPAGGNFRPVAGGNVFTAPAVAIPDFPGGDRPQPPLAPAGNLSNAVPVDRDGNLRSAPVAGAYADRDTECAPTFVLPGVARAPGVNGSFFRTTVWVTGRSPDSSDSSTRVRLSFVPWTGQAGGGLTNDLQGEVGVFGDALVDLFGFTGNTAGAVLGEACSGSSEPIVTARTFADAGEAGTFGQYIVPFRVRPEGDPAADDEVRIEGLQFGPSVRSNVGVVNLTSQPIEATVDVVDASGVPGGNPTSLVVPAWGSAQQMSAQSPGPAQTTTFSVRVSAPVRGIAAYASIVDNRTNDPIFVPGNLPERATQWIDGVASAPGTGTFFRTSLVLANRGSASADLSIGFTPRGSTAPSSSVPVRLAPGETRRFDDVLPELLGTTGAGSLTLRTADLTPVVAWARTFSDLGPSGTLGQFIPAFGPEDLLASTGAILPGLSDDGKFRANVGLANRGASDAVVTLELRSAAGTRLGTATRTVRAGESLFVQRALRQIVPDEVTDATLLVTVDRDRTIWPWASLVDNRSTDPTFVRPVK